MNKIFFLILLSATFIFTNAFAQSLIENDTLIGLVVNKRGKGIRNIPITASNTKLTVQTNRKGFFTIIGNNYPDTLNVFLPSKQLVQIPVKGMKYMKIFTKETGFSVSEAKDEIINIGYGTIKRSLSTSAGVTISGEELRQTGERNIKQAIAGKIPGVNVIYNENGATLRIRGGTSLETSVEPLYIVDGSIVDNIDYINLNDIEKVDVLKDGSMYGARGANGVIIITTRKY